jgi:hypothetical protein
MVNLAIALSGAGIELGKEAVRAGPEPVVPGGAWRPRVTMGVIGNPGENLNGAWSGAYRWMFRAHAHAARVEDRHRL